MVHQAALALDDPVRIPTRHFQNHSGVLRYLTPGLVLPLRDVLTLMIIVSDNACTGAVCEMVTLERVNEVCASLGMTRTAHREPMGGLRNVTTPNDMGKLLTTIVRGAEDPRTAETLGLTPALCTSALDTLKRQQFRQRMPSRLPEGTVVAHKTGVDVGSFSDAGIVYREERPRFVLAVYTNAVPRELPDGTPGFAAAGSLIGTLTRICWDHLT
jgi:beta-lactamase class A